MIPRIALAWLAVLLAVPLAVGRDEPKKDEPKKDDKPATAKAQFTNLVKEFNAERQQLMADINKAKDDERTKLIQKYQNQGKEYADKFLKLAEDHPKDAAAADALFWVVQNAPANKKAEEKVVAAIADMPAADLAKRLAMMRGGSVPLTDAVLKRAEKDDAGPAAADLLFWVVQSAPMNKKAEEKVVALIPGMKLADLRRNLPQFGGSAALIGAVAKRVEKEENDPLLPDVLGWLAATRVASKEVAEIAKAATARLVEKYPDHPAVVRICQSLAQSRAADAADQLRAIAAKATGPKVKSEAVFALGQQLAGKLNDHADSPAALAKAVAEAEKAMAEAVDLFGKAEMAARKDAAQAELTAFHDNPVRVGKDAPEIEGKDLDGKEFKLSDYRGKVVLLDFWGDW